MYQWFLQGLRHRPRQSIVRVECAALPGKLAERADCGRHPSVHIRFQFSPSAIRLVLGASCKLCHSRTHVMRFTNDAHRVHLRTTPLIITQFKQQLAPRPYPLSGPVQHPMPCRVVLICAAARLSGLCFCFAAIEWQTRSVNVFLLVACLALGQNYGPTSWFNHFNSQRNGQLPSQAPPKSDDAASIFVPFR